MTTSIEPTRHPRRSGTVYLVGGLLVAVLLGACGQGTAGGPATSPPGTAPTTLPAASDDAARLADAQRLLRTGPTATGPTQPAVTAARDGVVVTSWSTGPDVRTLRLHFSGAPSVAGPCGADYRAEQWASAATVVVAVLEVPRAAPPSDVACPAIAALRTVDVTLADPPAGRTVVSLAGGSVVPRTTGQVDGIPAR